MDQSVIANASPRAAGRVGYTLVMFLLFAAIVAVVLYFSFSLRTEQSLVIGIPATALYSVLCFSVKRGYRPLVVWWGVLALATAGWWTYLITH